MVAEKMQRVRKNRPCPVCGKPDWCLVAEDDAAAICARIEEGSVRRCGDAGYLHILTNRHNRHDGRRRSVRRRHLLTSVRTSSVVQDDFAGRTERYRRQLTSERLRVLARDLGVSGISLYRLGIGWDGGAFTFPMSSDFGKTIGIRRRFPSGQKASEKGSRAGLFIPRDLEESGLLVVAEGPTDTAAALDLGFDAIGRPNCNSLIEMTVRVASRRSEIAIISDTDDVGIKGATRLAHAMVLRCPCAKIIVPPAGIKDLRQWVQEGLTPKHLAEIIAATATIKLAVKFSRTGSAKGGRR